MPPYENLRRRDNAKPRPGLDDAPPQPAGLKRSTSLERVQAKLRAAKHKAKKKGKQLVKKAKVILDRDAWWTSLGYDPEVKARSVRWCWRALFLLTTALVAAARTFAAPAAPVAFSLFRAIATNALFTASGYALITDTYRNPPPAKGSDSHYCSTYLGPYAFFTKQSLTIQCAHLALSTAAEVALAPQFAEFAAVLPFGLGDAITATAPGLLTLAHAFAPFAAVIGIALTLLYLKLNWFEPTWRREVLDATNAKGIAFTEISLTAHCPALPIAVLDVLCVKRPYVYPLTHASCKSVTHFGASYCVFYCLLTLANYAVVERYPYPFMRALKTPWHWVVFCGALLVLVCGFILPLTFGLLWLNPTGGQAPY
mmetsp:Transcript_10241/g.30984  ORF Transcript_10241/g.30984 Transcript_10241/m.30984 type:complete len:369 (+) Transcript_10241:1595-2701(+)